MCTLEIHLFYKQEFYVTHGMASALGSGYRLLKKLFAAVFSFGPLSDSPNNKLPHSKTDLSGHDKEINEKRKKILDLK